VCVCVCVCVLQLRCYSIPFIHTELDHETYKICLYKEPTNVRNVRSTLYAHKNLQQHDLKMRSNVTRFRHLQKDYTTTLEYLQTTEPRTVRYDVITCIVKILLSFYTSRNGVFSIMLVPCIIRRSRNNQHYALICTTPLFYILAPTCFGSI
jgi:hypothetical protein